jgi:peroxiredoxin Q/BCP
MVNIGNQVPDFKVTNQKGEVISKESLLGSKYVVFFYPKDDSPGCTKQACSVRDNFRKIKQFGYQVFGVSPDKEAKHQKFIDKYEFNYDLLADTDKKMIEAFGAWGEKKFMGRVIVGVKRFTFFIDEDGIIRHIITKVKTKEHGNEILSAITEEIETVEQNIAGGSY